MARKPKSPRRRAVERFLVRSVAAPMAWLMRRLPVSCVRRLGHWLGTLLAWITPHRQRLAARNLETVFGNRFSPAERSAIALTVTRNMAKVFLELFRLPGLSHDDIRQLVPLDGADIIRQARARGKGVICVTGHFGNWEMLAARSAAEGFPTAVVARDASDTVTASLINRARESAGLIVLGRDDLRGMVRHLRANGCLGILPDQHTKAGAIHLPFLGRPAWVARGPAMLALRTGAAVVPMFCARTADGGLSAYVRPEIATDVSTEREEAVATIMGRINQALEEEIRERPEQWLWLHDRWKETEPAAAEPRRPDPA